MRHKSLAISYKCYFSPDYEVLLSDPIKPAAGAKVPPFTSGYFHSFTIYISQSSIARSRDIQWNIFIVGRVATSHLKRYRHSMQDNKRGWGGCRICWVDSKNTRIQYEMKNIVEEEEELRVAKKLVVDTEGPKILLYLDVRSFGYKSNVITCIPCNSAFANNGLKCISRIRFSNTYLE